MGTERGAGIQARGTSLRNALLEVERILQAVDASRTAQLAFDIELKDGRLSTENLEIIGAGAARHAEVGQILYEKFQGNAVIMRELQEQYPEAEHLKFAVNYSHCQMNAVQVQD